MPYQITQQQLAKFAPAIAAPALASAYTDAFNSAFKRSGIDSTLRRIRYFMAQSFFETQGYSKWEENLWYTTPARLVEVWPSRFTLDPAKVGTHALDKQGKPYPQALQLATNYVNSPQKLANNVYASRNGNGDEASGDGWKFRGRGCFHLTFKNNYLAYGRDMYGDPNKFVNNPEGVNTVVDRILSAVWFWQTNKLQALADSDSFTAMTGIINNSTATAPKRLEVLKVANAIFVG